jgi:hypothetical protein
MPSWLGAHLKKSTGTILPLPLPLLFKNGRSWGQAKEL